jgi:hypothetical protein
MVMICMAASFPENKIVLFPLLCQCIHVAAGMLLRGYFGIRTAISVKAYACMPPESGRIRMTAPSFEDKKAPGGNRLELFSLSKISLPFNYFSA